MAARRPYTSGDWMVQAGKEEEFVARWTEFTEWSLRNAEGAEYFALIQQLNDPRHFLSYGLWRDPDAVNKWRESPEFAEKLGRCRQLCDEFEAQDFALAAETKG